MTHNRRRFFLCTLTTVGLAVATAAADEPLDEIVVEATRRALPIAAVPAAVDVVGERDIQRAQPQLGLDESLVGVPGLFIQNRFNFAQDLRISIRGFGARASFGIRGIRILVDGIPETLADGQGGVDGIDLGSAARIEVLRGAASALYGNASGGVINITSELGTAEPAVQTRIAMGEFGYRQLQLKASGESGDLSYLVNLSDLDFDGFREHSEAENRQANVRMRYAFGERTQFDASLHVTDQPVANDPGGITREQANADPGSARDANVALDAGEALSQSRLGLLLRHETGSGGSLQVRNYYTWRDFDGLLPFTPGGAIGIDRLYAGAGVQYTHPHTVGGLASEVVAGLDYDRQDDDRRRFDNNAGARGALTLDQNELVTSVGLYVQKSIALGDAVQLTLGLRHDRVRFDVTDRFLADGDDSGDVTLEETSPMAGITWRVSDALNVYASAATAFETPTTTELANPSTAGGFNPDLDPQLATSYELGARGEIADRHRYSVAVFHVDVDDELVPFELAAFPGRDFFANAGSSRRRGIELSGTTALGAGWSASAAWTWSDFEFDRFVDDDGNDFSGNTIPGTPEHVASVTLDYRHPQGAFVTLETQYVDRQPANNANTAFADSYALTNLRAGFETARGDWSLAPFFGVSNAFNESYAGNVRINAFGGRYYEPGPPRMFYAGVRVRFQRR